MIHTRALKSSSTASLRARSSIGTVREISVPFRGAKSDRARVNSQVLLGHRLRPGTTLTEVLMSILIMSIGVVTLATLFPIAILRSVQATQLTNATILRYDAEAIIDLANANSHGSLACYVNGNHERVLARFGPDFTVCVSICHC